MNNDLFKRNTVIFLCIVIGLMVILVFVMVICDLIEYKKEKKKQPKIKDLQRQLELERATHRIRSEESDRSYEEHRALALAVRLCKDIDLNLNQLEELGLQRYNALQKIPHHITDLEYEELVKHYIIIQRARYERNISNQIKKSKA